MNRSALMESIERRAFEARIALTKLCSDANVSPTTASRWRKRQMAPRLSTIKKLEDELAKIESGGAKKGSSAGTNGTGPDQSAKES